MKLKFENFGVDQISDLMTERQFGWVKLSVGMFDEDTSAYPLIEFRVPIQYQRSSSVDDVRKAAFEAAREVAGFVNSLLSKHDLPAMQQLHDEREAAKEAESKRLQSLLTPEND